MARFNLTARFTQNHPTWRPVHAIDTRPCQDFNYVFENTPTNKQVNTTNMSPTLRPHPITFSLWYGFICNEINKCCNNLAGSCRTSAARTYFILLHIKTTATNRENPFELCRQIYHTRSYDMLQLFSENSMLLASTVQSQCTSFTDRRPDMTIAELCVIIDLTAHTCTCCISEDSYTSLYCYT